MAKSTSPTWTLIDLDTGEEYTSQFPAKDLTSDESTKYNSTWSLSREDPILQWVHGEERDHRFRARFWAKHSRDSIKADLERLQRAIKRDPELNRPHIFRYVNGYINVRCVVVSIGDVKYDSLRDDGSPRGAWLSITLRKYESFDIALTDPDAPPTSTRYYRLGSGETFEHAALMLYGNASLGDLIRRRNPSLDSDQVDQLVVAPEPKDIRKERLEPYSPCLIRSVEFVKLRNWMFERFSAKTYVAKKLTQAV